MPEFEVIDTHVHLARTTEEEIDNYPVPGRRSCGRFGTPDRVIVFMDGNCISRMVMMNLMPRRFRGPLAGKAKWQGLTEEQRQREEKRLVDLIGPRIREFNEWGCATSQRYPRLSAFSCVAKELGDAQAIVAEVVLRASQGAKGIKLHPGVFGFFPHDRALWPMYAKCQELGLPVLADSAPLPHSRILAVHPDPIASLETHSHVDYGEPANFEPVLKEFPKLNLVLAHLGSAWWDERVELAQKYPNVYFDTSQGFTAEDRLSFNPHRGLAEEDAVRIIRKIGVERIMFGTDFSALAWEPQLEQVLRLSLTDGEKQAILADNAKRILRL